MCRSGVRGHAGRAWQGRSVVRGERMRRDSPGAETPRSDGVRRVVQALVCADVTAEGGHGPNLLRDGGRVKTISLADLESCRKAFLTDSDL